MATLTAKYQPYPAYKPSGVAWLGEIPAHWEIKRLKYAADLNPKASEARGLAPDTEVSFVPMEAIGEYGGLRLSLTKEISDVRDGYTYFSDGDVVVAKITPCFENGKGSLASELVNGIAFGTTELHVVRCRPELDKRFAFYLTLTDSFRRLGEAEMYGAGGQKRVPESFITNLKHPIPPLPEQHAIAAFLDRETARIDALVAKKERLIELLQEKRTALITRAVTKGLDPDALMKNSGVEWLGKIPTHWEVKRLKYIADFINGAAFKPAEWGTEGTPIIRIQNLNGGDEFNHTTRKLPMEFTAQKGDILFGWSGNRGTSFGPFLWRREGEYYVNQHIFRVLPLNVENANREWFYWVLKAVTFHVERQAHGIIGMVHVTRDELGAIYIPFLPNMEEQQAIADFLDQETAKLDSLVAKVREAIKHLSELRSALISAAVTGRVDVREDVGCK
ncbi:MAG: restriction endonuclease subunit S [Chloroflexota bacterium]|nr:restriction endonuclease subunit S [Chloroflexota bacterium]